MMGAAAGPIIGAVIGVAGSAKAASDAKKAAEKLAANRDVNRPSDIQGMRNVLNKFFAGTVGGEGFLDPTNHPQMSQLQQNMLYFASPEFFRQQTDRFDPNSIIQEMISESLPGFRRELNDVLGGIGSRFSAQGNRFSSDLSRTQSTVGGQALREFESGFTNLMPQLLQTQIAAQGIIPSLIGGQSVGLNTLLSPQLATLQAASQFGSAGVGGGLSPALLSGLGASPLGAGLISGAESLIGFDYSIFGDANAAADAKFAKNHPNG